MYRENDPSKRHKVFVSYYHDDDQHYRDQFEDWFKNIFIFKSVQPGDIETDLSTEYVKRLIQEDYVSDSSVLIVLVGPGTRLRKHVDWEISAALNSKVHGYSGLMGILLPTFPLTPEGKYYPKNLPARLADNVATKYASVYRWDWVCAQDKRIVDAVGTAFSKRIHHTALINNSRVQMKANLSQ
jgi:hypothetical protein